MALEDQHVREEMNRKEKTKNTEIEMEDLNILEEDEDILLVQNKPKDINQKLNKQKALTLKLKINQNESEKEKQRRKNIEEREAFMINSGLAATVIVDKLELNHHNDLIVQVEDIFVDKEEELIGGHLWDGETKTKFIMSLEDYENTETHFKENSVLKVKKFKLKEILPASEKSALKLKQIDVLGQPGK